jgi:hypothetical protein
MRSCQVRTNLAAFQKAIKDSDAELAFEADGDAGPL